MIELGFQVPAERIEGTAYEIDTAGERAERLRPVLEDVMDLILYREKRMFESRGATSGVYWSPLKKATVEDKMRYGAPHPLSPLRGFTGALMKSLSERGAPYQDLDVTDEGLRLATHRPGAGYHAGGTSKMDARPPLIIPAKHAHEYVGMINDFIYHGDRDA